jgi:hypothetical protein
MRLRPSRRPSSARRTRSRHGLIAAGAVVGLLPAASAAVLIVTSYRDSIMAAEWHLTTLSLVPVEEIDRDVQAAELVQMGRIQSMRQDGIETSDALQHVMGTYAVNQDLVHRIAGLPQISALSVVDRQGRLIKASNGRSVGLTSPIGLSFAC